MTTLMEFMVLAEPPREALYAPGQIVRVRRVQVGPDQFLGASGVKARIESPPTTKVKLADGRWDIQYQVAVLFPLGEHRDTMPESWLEPITDD